MSMLPYPSAGGIKVFPDVVIEKVKVRNDDVVFTLFEVAARLPEDLFDRMPPYVGLRERKRGRAR